MRIRAIAMTLALSATMAAVATAADTELIEPDITGPVAAFGMSNAQSFTPTTTGVVREVSLWAQNTESGRASELIVHRGDRPGDELGRTSFEWDGNPTTVVLGTPVAVTGGETYTLQLVGAVAEVVFGDPDPYPGGELVLGTPTGWVTFTELNERCGGCLPFILDQRFSLEVVSADADGDGVLDADDRCDGTVLPDPSFSTLGRSRYAATPAGIVGFDGDVLASLADTGGCSTAQITARTGLGLGHLKFGLPRPHVERWIADVAAS